MKKTLLLLLFVLQFSVIGFSQTVYDTLELNKIKNEALNNSKAMEMLTYLSNVIGSRLMWSPQYAKAAEWIASKLNELNISKVYNENIDKKGKSWTLKKFYANLTNPYTLSIIGNPKCWSPGTNGVIKGEVVYLKVQTPEDLEKYRGKLNGKIVCIADPIPARISFRPMAVRYTDDSLKTLSNAGIPSMDEKEKNKEESEKNENAYLDYFKFIAKKVEFCKNEGAVLIIDYGSRYYGTNQVWANVAAVEPKNIYDFLIGYAGNPDIPESVPQIAISLEQYNCIIDALEKNVNVTMEVDIEVEKGGVEDGFNVIAEIPGTELENEIVIIGGHLDSYPFANGVVDNGTGVVVCMEALRIIKALGLEPKRTIRIGLWGAEEEGLIGSKFHILKHFIQGKEKFCTYFNMDFGVGKFRGIYAEENQGAAIVFNDWMKIINDPKFQTVCLSAVKDSDHDAFHQSGLPGFPFIQDPLDYYRMYHTNMDFVDRVPQDDLKQNAFIMAAFAWLAANYEGDFPVK